MPKAFLEFIDNIELVGGGIDKGSVLVDTLSVALTMLQYNDKILPENKHVIIMTNNEFYSTPVQTFNHFYNQTSDQLADHIYQNQFKLSVICPRKITGKGCSVIV